MFGSPTATNGFTRGLLQFQDFNVGGCLRVVEAYRRWGVVDPQLTQMALERIQATGVLWLGVSSARYPWMPGTLLSGWFRIAKEHRTPFWGAQILLWLLWAVFLFLHGFAFKGNQPQNKKVLAHFHSQQLCVLCVLLLFFPFFFLALFVSYIFFSVLVFVFLGGGTKTPAVCKTSHALLRCGSKLGHTAGFSLWFHFPGLAPFWGDPIFDHHSPM